MTDPSPEQPKLTPANQNPWYILMTLHGEQPEGAGAWDFDKELHAKNRRDWNRWAARGLSEERRAELRAMTDSEGKPRFDENELVPHDEKKFAALAAAFRKASGARGAAAALPEPGEVCDFAHVAFDRAFIAQGLLFPGNATLRGATFSGVADLQGATFSGYADLQGATFSGYADLQGATFSGYADLQGATFAGDAFFLGATFSGYADLQGATFAGNAFLRGVTFSGYADIQGATFSGYADIQGATFSGTADIEGATFSSDANLSGATFSGDANFSGAKFSRTHQADFSYATFKGKTKFLNAELEGETSFANAVFEQHPPSFHGAKLNEGVAFHGVRWPDPPTVPAPPTLPLKDDEAEQAQREFERAKETAQSHVYNYQRLKQLMEGLKKHEDELNFFAMEMAAQRVVDGKWSLRGILNGLYGAVSDYGRSILRPALAFFPFFAFSAPVFEQSARIGEGCAPLTGAQAAGVSLATFLSVLPGLKDTINYKCLNSFATFTAGFNAVVGAVLLFLIGLALRNRFRMK
jgi:uncharacterized protein YjbI with pentapeptide repeats